MHDIYTKTKFLRMLKKSVFHWMTYYSIDQYSQKYYDSILKPSIQGQGSLKRYFFSEERVKDFISKFQNGELRIIPPAGYIHTLDIYKSGLIYWTNSYQTIQKYMNRYAHILKPIRRGERNSGRGVFVSKKNVQEFIRRYEERSL